MGGGRRCTASSTAAASSAKVPGGGANEDFRDQETDLFAVHGNIDINLEKNNIR